MIAAMTRRVTRAERIDPTPETLARIQPDPLSRLREDGVIDLDQMRAGEEIRDTWHAMTRGVMFGVSWVKRSNWLGEMASGGVPIGPAEAMYRAVWQPWQKRQGRAVGMVLNVIVDGWPLLMPRTFRRALDDWNELRGR